MNEFQVPGLSAVSQSQTVNYFRLESESSMQSEDTESVTSLQGRETEYAKDSEDTDELSDEYLEYEVASLSEADVAPSGASSSYGTDDDIKFAEEVIAAVLGDTSVEAWSADGGEDSCSSTESEDTSKTDFRICAQCKSKNSNPRFLFCEKCYQVRKSFYPPPPKRCKKRNNESKVNVDNLRNCLSGLSQDSGVGSSSQEFLSLDFKEIKVPQQHLDKCGGSSSSSGVSSGSSSGSSNSVKICEANDVQTTNRKRKSSDSVSDNEVRPKRIIIDGACDTKKEKTENLNDRLEKKTDSKDVCIVCTVAKIDGIFAHGVSAHASCCYSCATKIWKTTKRCPVCNRRVSSVFRLYRC